MGEFTDVKVVVLEIVDQSLKAPRLARHYLEVIERAEDDLVASADEADGSEQLEH